MNAVTQLSGQAGPIKLIEPCEQSARGNAAAKPAKPADTARGGHNSQSPTS
jgi:hypothetical protein